MGNRSIPRRTRRRGSLKQPFTQDQIKEIFTQADVGGQPTTDVARGAKLIPT
jgi:hypothetical protein